MKASSLCLSGFVSAAAVLSLTHGLVADEPVDFGLFVEHQLNARSEQLFGIVGPLQQSALGPFTGANSAEAVTVAQSLQVSVVSTAAHFSADQIAFWPDDDNPQFLYVCDESSSNPAVQRIDLSKPANANATTIVTGLSECDPVRRTPWGSIIVAEEGGLTGGFYEIMDPSHVNSPIAVTNRDAGTTSDPAHLVKRKAVGSLSFEGMVILDNGTMYFADELRPANGASGGAIYKFIPQFPYLGGGQITQADQSPFAHGTLFGLKIGTNSPNDTGQGTEIGQGVWTSINPLQFTDVNGNVLLRNAQVAQRFTGYYRPEDMDRDPIAEENDILRMCFTATGRMSNGGGSSVETASTFGEVLCLVDAPNAAAVTGATPTMTRFIAGDHQLNYVDNLDFQPHTGNLVLLEDGEVVVVKPDNTTELRGNDIWMCLPDGADRDVQSDGCIRILSLRDTSSEPTGFIFTGSGRTAFVNLQHRNTNQGALLKITGFKVDDNGHTNGHGHEGGKR
jgi:secreted PhoX family phosphatase